jgi:hypothetical protein
LTDPERHFLLHRTHEAKGPFWGPATIWCVNHRVNPAYGPYPLAEVFWGEEREAGRTFWAGERPKVSFQVPWPDVESFWVCVDMALSQIPRLQGDQRFTPRGFSRPMEGALTPEESNFLRAYNAEMVEAGIGRHIELAHQGGVQGHHLIPFFALLDDLDRPPTLPAAYPWTDFSARYESLSGRTYDSPGFAP